MSALRTMSTFRLLIALAAIAALAAVAAAIAVAGSGGGGTPPPKPLAQAIHDSLSGPRVDGITARVTFTNNLLPSGALTGSVGSALLSGATGRLWATADGRGRLELQSNAGDTQVVWDHMQVTAYDASSNTTYRFALPADMSPATTDSGGPVPTLTQIADFLTKAAAHTTIGNAQPTDVGGQPAYSVSVSPKVDGGLIGTMEVAWDAAHAVPLRIAVTAKGSSAPVFELTATDVSYGAVATSDVEVSPPPGAKLVELSPPTSTSGSGETGSKITGLPAVAQKVSFTIVAPETLAGRARSGVRLVGGDTALLVYGHGLDSIVVDERATDRASGGQLAALPATVSLDGVTAHELATPLGTVLEWQRGGVAFTLAGSVEQTAAERAARELR